MPRFLVPRKHGPHRVAAIALYRALLRQTFAAGDGPSPLLAPAQQHDLAVLIRSRFRRNIHLQSKRLLGRAFGHAWAVLDALDRGVSGSSSSSSTAADAATWLTAQIARPDSQILLGRLRADNNGGGARDDTPNPRRPVFSHPDAGLRARPLPLDKLRPRRDTQDTTTTTTIMPQRRIPVLFSANKIPVLRLDKPQPPGLSMYIQLLVDLRTRRWARVEEYDVLTGLGEREDEWDRLVGGGEAVGGKVSWAEAGELASQQVYGHLDRRDELSAQRARWYLQIVDEEREMKEMERKDRVRERNRRAWERKKERFLAEGREWIETGDNADN